MNDTNTLLRLHSYRTQNKYKNKNYPVRNTLNITLDKETKTKIEFTQEINTLMQTHTHRKKTKKVKIYI